MIDWLLGKRHNREVVQLNLNVLSSWVELRRALRVIGGCCKLLVCVNNLVAGEEYFVFGHDEMMFAVQCWMIEKIRVESASEGEGRRSWLPWKTFL